MADQQVINITVKEETSGGGRPSSPPLPSNPGNPSGGSPNTPGVDPVDWTTDTSSSLRGGGFISSVGSALGGPALASGLAGVAAGLGLVATAAGIAVAGFFALTHAMKDAVDSVGGFSSSVIEARVQNSLLMLNARLERANRIGDELGEFEKQRGRTEAILYELKTAILGDVAGPMTDLTKVLNGVLIVATKMFEGDDDNVPDWMKSLVKWVIGGVMTPVWEEDWRLLKEISQTLQDQWDQQHRESMDDFFDKIDDDFIFNNNLLWQNQAPAGPANPLGNNAFGIGGR